MKFGRFFAFLLIIFILGLIAVYYPKITGNVSPSSRESAILLRVVDGDTIDTNLGKVRLLGINTPEKGMPGYQGAKDFVSKLNGSRIELERTVEDKDQYNRSLRYVFFDGRFVNLEILMNGYAHFYAYNDDKYTKILKSAEDTARNNGLGIWEKSNNTCSSCIVLKKLNNVDPGEYVILGNLCNFKCDLNGWTIIDDARHEITLDFSIEGLSDKRIDYNGSVWNDDGDSFYLRDPNGFLVVFYRY